MNFTVNIIKYFNKKYPTLVNLMKKTEHGYNNLNDYHLEGSVWTHTMMVLKELENESKELQLAALLHDVGKPFSIEIVDKLEKSKDLAKDFPEEFLEYSSKNISEITFMEYLEDNPSRYKKRFIGHEGISFYISIDVLSDMVKDNLISENEKILCLKLIVDHGSIFDYLEDDKIDKLKNMFNNEEYFKNLLRFIRGDLLGRFNTDEDSGVTKLQVIERLLNEEFKVTKQNIEYSSEFVLLSGVPLSGKSTFKKNFKDFKDIERDRTLQDYAKEKGIIGTYSEIYKTLSKEDHLEIDKLIDKEFSTYIKDNKNILIDMTMTSKKSRKRFLSKIPSTYNKTAYVLLTGMKEIFTRNKIRYKETGKHIPKSVIISMMKSFNLPNTEEFNNVILIKGN